MGWWEYERLHPFFSPFWCENRKSPRVRFPRFLGKPNLRPEGEDQLCGTIFFWEHEKASIFFSPTALAMGSLPIKAPGQFRGGFRGAGSRAGSESRVPDRFWTTGSGKVPGQVPNHGFRCRFRGTGFPRDGSRTVLARFLDFRKKAYDLWPMQLFFFFNFSAVVAKRLEKTRFLNIPFKSGSVGRVTCSWCVDFPSRSRL